MEKVVISIYIKGCCLKGSQKIVYHFIYSLSNWDGLSKMKVRLLLSTQISSDIREIL